jgi:hypothetical protein
MRAPELLKVPENESRLIPRDQEKKSARQKLVGNFKTAEAV